MSGLTKIPGILFIVKGKISIFNIDSTIKFDKLTNFIHKNYPKEEVPVLNTPKEVEIFLKHEGISMILFSKFKDPTSIEKELRYNYKDYHSFAHVHISSNSHWAFKKFIELSGTGLPSICIQNKTKSETETQWIDSLNREVRKIIFIDF